MKGMCDCRVYGGKIDDGGGLGACVVWGFHSEGEDIAFFSVIFGI